MEGWIKLHRRFLEWEWYDDNNTKILFLHLLLKANHKDKKYRGQIVKRGSLLTGRELLSKETGLTERQIRTSLNKLKATNEIAIKSSPQGSEIQIVKYNDYQVVTNETTNERPTSDQRATSNKNVKNDKKVFVPPTFQEVSDYCLSRKNNVDAQRFVDFYTSKGWLVGKSKMKDWKAALRTWEKDNPKQQSVKVVGGVNMDYIKEQQKLYYGDTK